MFTREALCGFPWNPPSHPHDSSLTFSRIINYFPLTRASLRASLALSRAFTFGWNHISLLCACFKDDEFCGKLFAENIGRWFDGTSDTCTSAVLLFLARNNLRNTFRSEFHSMAHSWWVLCKIMLIYELCRWDSGSCSRLCQLLDTSERTHVSMEGEALLKITFWFHWIITRRHHHPFCGLTILTCW